MKQVTLNIPDEKYDFFMELIESLGLESRELVIPEAHKKIVLERIKSSSPNEFISWEDAKAILAIK